MNTQILDEKKKIVEEIASMISSSASTIVVEYRGLSVKALETLRRDLAKQNIQMHVFKNTLVNKAVDNLKIKFSTLEGPNAFIFSKDDVVAGPKIITGFAKKNDKLVIKGGIVDKKEINKNEIMTLATLPSREGLLSMFIGCLNEPIRKLAATLQAVAEKSA